jgi:hypothetical protein
MLSDPQHPWPHWAAPLLAEVERGGRIHTTARKLGIAPSGVYQLANRCDVFSARLSQACGRPLGRPAVEPLHDAPALTPLACHHLRFSLQGERLAQLALAVVLEARRAANHGNRDAVAWLAQVRADVLEVAPDRLRRRLASVGD